MAKLIDKITPKQEAQAPLYVDKWVKIGSSVDNPSFSETKKIVDNFRELIGFEKAPLLVLNNPLEAWIACELIVNYNFVSKTEIRKEIREFLTKGNPKKWLVSTPTLPYQSGSFQASKFSFYDYMFNCLKIPIDQELLDKYRVWKETTKIGPIYPLENFSVVSKKPLEIHMEQRGGRNVLHNETGPAIKWGGIGDLDSYCLNGVEVPKWIITTPRHKIDVLNVLKEKNADVKAECVRFLGVEAFLKYGKKIDSYENYPDNTEYEYWHKSQYVLWDMSKLFDGLEYAPFLQMTNLTTGIFHLEGVSPSCNNVGEALKERFGKEHFILRDVK